MYTKDRRELRNTARLRYVDKGALYCTVLSFIFSPAFLRFFFIFLQTKEGRENDSVLTGSRTFAVVAQNVNSTFGNGQRRTEEETTNKQAPCFTAVGAREASDPPMVAPKTTPHPLARRKEKKKKISVQTTLLLVRPPHFEWQIALAASHYIRFGGVAKGNALLGARPLNLFFSGDGIEGPCSCRVHRWLSKVSSCASCP